MGLIEDTNWPIAGIMYLVIVIAIWKFSLMGGEPGAEGALFKIRLFMSIIMLPITVGIVYIMGDR